MIRKVIAALGGPEPTGYRFAAWWRGSKALNCSISKNGLTFFDHVIGKGGDTCCLVQLASGVGVAEALRWLEAHWLREPQRPLTRMELQRRRVVLETEQDRRESTEFFRVAFNSELDRAKLAARDADYIEALERAARLQWHLGQWPMGVFDLAEAINRIDTQRLIEAGRADLQHAAEVTLAAVDLLSASQGLDLHNAA